MKNDKERSYFSLRTMFYKCLFSMPKCVWKVHHKNWSFQWQKYTKKLYAKYSHKCPRTFPHSYVLLRCLVPLEKPFYVKLTTFSTAYGAKNETKLIADLKSTSKKYEVTLESFPNFAYVSSYLHLKHFAWKREYTIS